MREVARWMREVVEQKRGVLYCTVLAGRFSMPTVWNNHALHLDAMRVGGSQYVLSGITMCRIPMQCVQAAHHVCCPKQACSRFWVFEEPLTIYEIIRSHPMLTRERRDYIPNNNPTAASTASFSSRDAQHY